jgi:hypothetical protein
MLSSTEVHAPESAATTMNTPLLFSFAYLILGMVTTSVLWTSMQLEIETALSLEDDEAQGVLRFFLTIVFVLAWPVVLWDVVRNS